VRDWSRRRLVITAGPTREHLDPVRYLSNESSGRMGWALAETAHKRGARVTLVTGPTSFPDPKGVTVIRVVNARDMLAATRKAAHHAHAVIGAAAVADWRPHRVSRTKLKKRSTAPVIRLVANPDILATLSKERRGPFPRMAGFALESNNLLANAQEKMRLKNLDLVVANSPRALGSVRTRAILIQTGRPPHRFSGDKKRLADLILSNLLEGIRSHD
jgi:phosphopantothenoylcysteine decarboxylase/phosphopantothenate--cysteine ligase